MFTFNSDSYTYSAFGKFDCVFEINDEGLIARDYEKVKRDAAILIVTDSGQLLIGIKQSPIDVYYSNNFYSCKYFISEEWVRLICTSVGLLIDNPLFERNFPSELKPTWGLVKCSDFKKVAAEMFLRPIADRYHYILFHDHSSFSEKPEHYSFERLASYDVAVAYLNTELDVIINEETMDWKQPYFLLISNDKRIFRKYQLTESVDDYRRRGADGLGNLLNVFNTLLEANYTRAYRPTEREIWNSDDGNSYENTTTLNWIFE